MLLALFTLLAVVQVTATLPPTFNAESLVVLPSAFLIAVVVAVSL